MTANLTAQLLGDSAGWDAVHVELDSVQGLWGGRIISVAGSGTVVVQRIGPGARQERRYEFALSREEIAALLNVLIAHDLLAIEMPERSWLVPDEAQTLLTVRKGQRTFSLMTWANDPADARVSAVIEALRSLEARTDGLTPAYEGPYQAR